MVYLSPEQILIIHSFVLDETGGLHGVRDRDAIASARALAQQQAFGQELYPTVFDKAAVYIRSIIKNHPFVDGNKRSGMMTAAVFLELNGYKLQVSKGGVYKFALRVAKQKLELAKIATWLKQNSKKLK